MSGGTPAVAERTGGTPGTGNPVPVRLASVYLPAPVPREGRVAFWDPDGGPLPDAATEDLTVVRRHGSG
ncbi:hypothetical protein ACWDZX_30615, partial [Streptomyces collinus]